ncbi:DUF4406 domain-containing protein [Actinomyces howellii]|nr:DUF4406 domain-containing protein [Actinomyces howellii]
MRRVYVAGPITGVPDYEVFFRAACRALRSAGFEPVSPAHLPVKSARQCRRPGDDEWRMWMRATGHLLLECDGVALIDGWRESRGARIEAFWARRLRLPVKPLEHWVIPAASGEGEETAGRSSDGTGMSEESQMSEHHDLSDQVYDLVNCTPHNLRFKAGDYWVEVPPEMTPAPRLTLSTEHTTRVAVRMGSARVTGDGLTTDVTNLDMAATVLSGRRPTGCEPPLPDGVGGVLVVVPRAIAEYFAHREDLVWPDRLVRDVDGSVIGCTALGALWAPEGIDLFVEES